MDAAVRDIHITEIRISDALDAQIDKDIELSEPELKTGEFVEAHEEHRLIKAELQGVPVNTPIRGFTNCLLETI